VRPGVLRRGLALAASAIIISTGAVYADGIQITDGDTTVSPPNISYTLTGSGTSRLCSKLGDTVPGQLTVRFGGSTHLTAGAATTTAVTPAAANLSNSITVTPGAANVPSPWTNATPDFSIGLSTVVPAGTYDGTYRFLFTVTAGITIGGTGDAFDITLACDNPRPSGNAAPEISNAAFSASNVDCRVQETMTVTFTDEDSSAWYAEIDWDYISPSFDVETTVPDITASPFTANHTYNTPGTYTAAVRVYDGEGAVSNISTATLTVDQSYTVTFLAPFDASNASLAVINKAKAGRVVPVKVTIYDNCTLAAYAGSDLPRIAVKHATLPTGTTTDGIEYYADAGAANVNDRYFRMADGFWIYNLATASGSQFTFTTGESYRIDVYVGSVLATDDEWAVLAMVK